MTPRLRPRFTTEALPHRLSGSNRLVDAPLTVEDWRMVYLAYQGFMQQVRLIAEAARQREKERVP